MAATARGRWREGLGTTLQVGRKIVDGHLDGGGALASGAIAFYAMLSVAPVLVVATAMAGMLFGSGAAHRQLVSQLELVLSPRVAHLVAALIREAQLTGGGWLGTVVGVGFMLFGASRLFAALQRALNQIWGIRPARRSDERFRDQAKVVMRKRLWSFVMVLLTGLALAGLVAAETALGLILGWVGLADTYAAHLMQLALSMATLGVMVAAVFKVLPDAKLGWRDVWIGAAATAVLLSVGSWALSVYFRKAAPASSFGAAGALAALLLWVYYSAHIFFLGAQLTWVLARTWGHGVRPESHAEVVVSD